MVWAQQSIALHWISQTNQGSTKTGVNSAQEAVN